MTFPQCCPFFSVDMSRQGELVCFASRPVGRCQYDLCPFDLGPWGAWRSGYASVAAYADVDELGFGAIDEYFAMRHALRAVGWSP